MESASSNYQYIYKSCVKYNPNKKLSIKQIEEILMKEINSFNYLEKYLYQEITDEKIVNITQYLTENIFF